MTLWKTTFLYKQEVFHFHVSESECEVFMKQSCSSDPFQGSNKKAPISCVTPARFRFTVSLVPFPTAPPSTPFISLHSFSG